MKKRGTNEVTATGVVVPVNWDDHGIVTAVAISTNDEEMIFVEPRGKGTALFNLVRAEIEVTGKVKMKAGAKRMTVTDYQLKKTWD